MLARALIAVCLLLVQVAAAPAQTAQGGPVAIQETQAFIDWYRFQSRPFFSRYMDAEGRIFDPENGGISHSEGQAYGMGIAFAGNSPELFDRIWTWTKRNLRQPDGLHAWKYVPGRGVVDTNNATDGDLIIAAVLAAAATRWGRDDYMVDARQTADALGREVLREYKGYVLMLPSKFGFDRTSQPDGPILNMSYYHFSIMRSVKDLAPAYPWEAAIATGWSLYQRIAVEWQPSDWTSVADPADPSPARNFPNRASYDAIRGIINILAAPWQLNPELLAAINSRLKMHGGTLGIWDISLGRRSAELDGDGYDLMAASVQCVAEGVPVPRRLLEVSANTYFSTALHLITIYRLYTRQPQCIG